MKVKITKAKEKVLMAGNEAIAEAAFQAGCFFYAGYPITPQNELIAYLSWRLPDAGRVFVQAESELAAINMVFGASASGVRSMTSSSSPGVSLKQEGISYLAGARLPAVIVNIMRGGPGLGNIAPSQSDYFQATRGGGHGDYHCLVFAPAGVQEAFDLTVLAFDLSDKYRVPAMILGDGMLGQMMEPILVRSKELGVGKQGLPTPNSQLPTKPWALTGCAGRVANVVKSFFLAEGALEKNNLILQETYQLIRKNEPRFETFHTQDAKVILVAYGTMARIVKAVVKDLRKEGKKVGLIRPISLWPFPDRAFGIAKKSKTFLVVEMSYGQMLEDVKLTINGRAKVEFLGRSGGGIPTEEEITKKIKALY